MFSMFVHAQDPVHVYPAPFPDVLLTAPPPPGGTGTLAAHPGDWT